MEREEAEGLWSPQTIVTLHRGHHQPTGSGSSKDGQRPEDSEGSGPLPALDIMLPGTEEQKSTFLLL